MRGISFVVAVVLCCVTGCGSDDSDDTGVGGSGGASAWDPANPARCELAPYTWLPATEVGSVLEQSLALDVSLAQIQTLVTLAASSGAGKIAHPMLHPVSIYVMRYQTQDKGKLVDATALVGIPNVSTPTTLPILEFLHGTSGFDDGCAPSLGAGDISKNFTIFAAAYASAGYVSVLPDYIGMKSLGSPSEQPIAYTIAEPTAIGSLDAIRAAKALVADVTTSITLGDVVIAGHSQGGHATEATARFAPFYAPELVIAGAAPVAAPTDLVGAFGALLSQATIDPGYLALGVSWAYLAREYYAGPALSQVLIPPWDVQAEAVVLNRCSTGYQDPLAGVTEVHAVAQPALIDMMANGGSGFDPWSCYALENSPSQMPVPMGTTPMLYVLGASDPLVVPEPQRNAFDTLCEKGAKLVFLECEGANHGQALSYSVDDQLDFFEARLAGEPLPATLCQKQAAVKCKSTL